MIPKLMEWDRNLLIKLDFCPTLFYEENTMFYCKKDAQIILCIVALNGWNMPQRHHTCPK